VQQHGSPPSCPAFMVEVPSGHKAIAESGTAA
jgi:hypothetical protein